MNYSKYLNQNNSDIKKYTSNIKGWIKIILLDGLQWYDYIWVDYSDI